MIGAGCTIRSTNELAGRIRADRLRGAVWGHLIGDAVGVPYEFREPSVIGEVVFGARGTHGQPPGTWSDDGALMLALLDSLTSVGFDVEDQGRRALDWADRGAYTPDGDGKFDIGNATADALARIRNGEPAQTAGGAGDRDLGNGSLMRILPIALVEPDATDDSLAARAHRASAVTHRHTVAQVTCALYVLVAFVPIAVLTAAVSQIGLGRRPVYLGPPRRPSANDGC